MISTGDGSARLAANTRAWKPYPDPDPTDAPPISTSELPPVTLVQPDTADPTRAAGLPLINTVAAPCVILAVWGTHFLPAGLRCKLVLSPTLAADLPLMKTSGLPLAIVQGLQWISPGSPRLAAAGMVSSCDYLLPDWRYASGGLYPAVAHIIARFSYHGPTSII